MIYTTRQHCRVCDGSLKRVIYLGELYVSTFSEEADGYKAPIDLMRCEVCGLVQLRDTVDPNYMYSDYWYRSNLNNSMRIALKNVVDSVERRMYSFYYGDVVVDIGANDGTMLKNYPEYVTTVAFEPSKLASEIKADIVINNFFCAEYYFKAIQEKANVVTAIAMLYDLEDPRSFLKDVKRILADGGVFVAQFTDLLCTLRLNDFSNLCHEHIEYYSLQDLNKLLHDVGLKIFDVEYNDVNGGSVRIYVCHEEDPIRHISPNVEKALCDEQLLLDKLLNTFSDNVFSIINRLQNFFQNNTKTVHVLAASTKGNTILQVLGLTDKDIPYAAEVNPDKFGKRTVGSNILIIPQEESLVMNPDYYFVLAYGFVDNFIKKFWSYLENGGKFIVPLPEPCIISVEQNVIVKRYL